MWVKSRHKAVYAFFKPIFRLYTKQRYNFNAVPSGLKKGSYLIMSNHQASFDPIFLALSFDFPIYYFASDDLFTHKFISPALKFLVAPIPKSKSMKDLQAVRDCVQVLKEGGSVGLFPEGNRTYTGKPWAIDISAAKLAKIARVPLVLYNLSGGYGSDPRFAHSVRKGKITGEAVKVLQPEEYMKMSNEQLLEIIVNTLDVDELHPKTPFKSKQSAEYLERVLYYCPDCKKEGYLHSQGNIFFCKNCGLSVKYTEYLRFETVKGYCPFQNIKEWHDEQFLRLKERVKKTENNNKETFFTDTNVRLMVYRKGRRKQKLDKGSLVITADKLTLHGKTDIVFEIKNITAMTVLGKNKINFYTEDNIYQLKGEKRFNALKYLRLFNLLQNPQ